MFIVNGISVNHRIDGKDGAPWVTFITGIANDLSMWDAQAAALEREFRVLRYDLRGHGGTQATQRPYSIGLLVEDQAFAEPIWSDWGSAARSRRRRPSSIPGASAS
jgi:pimeloyl-ACP methyl ester carboxylesterase